MSFADSMSGPTVALPRMHKEAGERRDFLPSLVEFLDRVGAGRILVEEGYGTGMGLSPQQYLQQSSRAALVSWEECYRADVVVVLRCPDAYLLRSLRPGSVLVSMLHLPTRPARVQLLESLGVRGVSLDLVQDDLGTRLVQNLEAVGWNGVRAAIEQLAIRYPAFASPGRPPLRVTLLGSGAVGSHAARAAVAYGNPVLRQRLAAQNVPGVEVTLLDRELTSGHEYMLERLERTDLLIDATQRADPSQVVVPNDWISALPEHAVILDLAVDPYDFSRDPPSQKGIEGIPEGDLDQYVFAPDDPAYGRLPPAVQSTHRRTALACYSWPGVDPKACMEVYSKQLEPVLRAVIEKGLDQLDPVQGPYYERATARAELARWRSQGSRPR